MAWRAMSSAPTNGTIVDLWVGRTSTTPGWREPDMGFAQGVWCAGADPAWPLSDFTPAKPNYWMSRPAPPA